MTEVTAETTTGLPASGRKLITPARTSCLKLRGLGVIKLGSVTTRIVARKSPVPRAKHNTLVLSGSSVPATGMKDTRTSSVVADITSCYAECTGTLSLTFPKLITCRPSGVPAVQASSAVAVTVVGPTSPDKVTVVKILLGRAVVKPTIVPASIPSAYTQEPTIVLKPNSLPNEPSRKEVEPTIVVRTSFPLITLLSGPAPFSLVQVNTLP